MVRDRRCGSGRRRLGLYSGAALTVSFLIWAGFVYAPAPDPGQRLEAAHVYAQLRAFELARAEVEAVVESEPQRLDAQMWLAYIDEAQGHPGAAAIIYRNLVDDVEDAELRCSVLRSLAANCLKSGRPRSAQRAARQLVEANRNDPVGWMLEALSCYQLGDDKSFLDKASHAFMLNPEDPVFRLAPEAILPRGVGRGAYEARITALAEMLAREG